MSLNDIIFFGVGILILFFGFIVFIGAPYVPSRNKDLKQAFEKLYKLSSSDLLVDLGSGDGKVLKLASEFGASSLGYELNPILLLLSKFNLRNIKHTKIEWKNCWTKVPNQTTIIYAFVVSRDVPKLENVIIKSLAERKKPIYVMTYGTGLRKEFSKPISTIGAHNLYKLEPLHNVQHKYNKNYV